MIFIETDGLKYTKLLPKVPVPIYMTDYYEVIEAPTYWAMDLTKKRSRSKETLKQYTTNLARYLQWRDYYETDGAKNWQLTDEDIINEYIGYLKEERDELRRPNDQSIEGYIALLSYFFKWASNKGYDHYWKIDVTKVVHTIKDRYMVNKEIENDERIHIQNGKPTHVGQELDKFIHKENVAKVLGLFDDVVYAFAGLVLWRTGLRPKEFFQLPYRGVGLNAGLRRYYDDELKDIIPILFEFESKGKRRSIKIPPDLWAFICRMWMPERVVRADRYREKHGVMPPNSALFLSKDGTILTYKMLYDNFNKVTLKSECPEKKIYPYMFRHAFATYFVFDRLKAHDLLGKDYVYNAVIDAELREWMGHKDIDTTYYNYVHLVNRYFYTDLLDDLYKPENKEIFDVIEKMYY